MKPIYLDYNATTPVDMKVAEAMRPYISEYFGNPSSIHSFGVKTKKAIENARQQVAGMLGCDPSEIIFTSGGTESNNYAIKGIALKHRERGNHIITSSVEHPAVIEVCRYLEHTGFEVTYLPVDKYGQVMIGSVKDAIRDNTIMITIMHANNEVGTVQPIAEISEIARSHNIFIHTDAAQSAGKIETRVDKLGVDLLSIAGHKIYAPKGIGALYIRNGVNLEKLIHGADHEQNMRAGTENVLEIVGLGKACELVMNNLKEYMAHYKLTKDHLYKLLSESFTDLRINGHPEECLPNTLSVSFPGLEANTLISRLDNVAASAGAACHAESIDVSEVLKAMKVPLEYSMGTIRFSTGRETALEDIEKASEEIVAAASSLMPEKAKKTPGIKKEKIKLTHYTHGLGCACKIQPQNLEKVLGSIPVFEKPEILVGIETSDDASVYRINNEQAIVQTLDFFTPVVDDPYSFGSIAAANALSDIYAMGAKPLYGLNIVGFPEDTLPLYILEQILKGASDKAAEAGISILGGHTIEDPEPKYGLVVTGLVHPDRIIRNKGARPGDKLILTKPIGTGILTTALKRGLISEKKEEELIDIMSELNKVPAEIMTDYDIHACTDVTGYGLAGHLREMSKASGCNVVIYPDMIPFIGEAHNMAAAGIIPGGTYNNHKYVEADIDFGSYNRTMQLLICDAQTSGGLLIAIDKNDAGMCLEKLHEAGIDRAAIIGDFKNTGKGNISVL
ncbi:MAG TPA: selenide, water dikinase SelD [Bacteroidales bacterium]|nr:selenide, water dikinase SelD [Bacteroidales bacterium]